MGKTYCIAGAVGKNGGYQIVRPLLVKNRAAPVRNVGWTAWQLDGHKRWEIFELIGPQPAEQQLPHVEDMWVRSLRPRGCLASAQERCAVLQATLAHSEQALFGAPLTVTYSAAYLESGAGSRSLATVLVPAAALKFGAVKRAGALEADFRVSLPVPGAGERCIAVKDHHLIRCIECAAATLDGQLEKLTEAVRQMGDQVAVRLGLSRAFQGTQGGPSVCWLMADGFFSFTDPQS